MNSASPSFGLLLALAACSVDRTPADPPTAESETNLPAPEPGPVADLDPSNAANPSPPHIGDPPSSDSRGEAPAYPGRPLVLAEWRKAGNRGDCAPLAFRDDGSADGTPRRATFSGGWAVAFDLPNLRSAYGVAGPGLIPADRVSHARRSAELRRQWPYVRPLGGREGDLPAGSIAGYGLAGAEPYSADSPQGSGQQSLAFVRIPGQTCTYNVWSRLGRDHLELLLDNLALVGE